jgi:AcrR family transcriptional regulator
MARRDDVLREAVALVRAGGPGALTSGNVAGALGLTQSAIYRHVRDMDELTALTSDVIVGELVTVVHQLLLDADIEWGDTGSFRLISVRLVETMAAQPQAFRVVDRWRFEPGELGLGIRRTLATAAAVAGDLLEQEWRAEAGWTAPLDDTNRAVLDAYAQLMQDEVIAVARLVGSHAGPEDRDEMTGLLEYRLLSGWYSLCVDLNDRLGLDKPLVTFP